MLTVVNSGLGNVGSILSMLRKLGQSAVVATSREQVLAATKLVLPGVGSYDAAVRSLKERELWDPLAQKVYVDKTPILGICLGMQLFAHGSEEGKLQGFGWIPARFVKFRPSQDSQLRVPHMGWNFVRPVRPSSLFLKEDSRRRFYFVHSYKAICDDPEDVLSVTDYDGEFVSAFGRGNIFGVQFHPEKSHRFGLELFGAFLRI